MKPILRTVALVMPTLLVVNPVPGFAAEGCGPGQQCFAGICVDCPADPRCPGNPRGITDPRGAADPREPLDPRGPADPRGPRH